MQNKFEIYRQTKHLSFIVKEHKPKTKVFAVVNRMTKEEIGVVRWQSSQYFFFPYPNTKWNANFLLPIAALLDELKPTKRKKTIAVVAHTVNDFLDWKRRRNHIKYSGTKRKYTRGNSTYVCITKPCDVRGYTIDKVIETEQAYLNPKIVDIMTVIQPNIRPQKKT